MKRLVLLLPLLALAAAPTRAEDPATNAVAAAELTAASEIVGQQDASNAVPARATNHACGRDASEGPFHPFSIGVWDSPTLRNTNWDVCGLALSLPYSRHTHVQGVHLGFANIVDCRMVGLQAGVFNQARELDGVQIGLVNTSEGAVRGVQLGIVNDAWQLRGVQFGFINYSEFLSGGVQFGLFNVVPEQRFEGVYQTPFGSMDMAVMSRGVQCDIGEKKGSVHLKYQLDIQGNYASTNELHLEYTENGSESIQ